MKINVKKNQERIFNTLVGPYGTLLRVGNAIAFVGRGSFSTIYNMIFVRPELIAVPTVVAKIGQYCEFYQNVQLILGGEHIRGNDLVNTFSGSFHIRKALNEIDDIKPTSKGLINIGNNVIASSGATFLSGADVGNNVIVAAGSLVCGQHHPNQIVGGNPAKQIRELNAPAIEWWNLSESCIVEYFKTKAVKTPVNNGVIDLYLVFDGKQDKDGRIIHMDLSGISLKEKFIPISQLAPHHLSYFSNANNDGDFITVSDEVFDDLL